MGACATTATVIYDQHLHRSLPSRAVYKSAGQNNVRRLVDRFRQDYRPRSVTPVPLALVCATLHQKLSERPCGQALRPDLQNATRQDAEPDCLHVSSKSAAAALVRQQAQHAGLQRAQQQWHLVAQGFAQPAPRKDHRQPSCQLRGPQIHRDNAQLLCGGQHFRARGALRHYRSLQVAIAGLLLPTGIMWV